MRHLDAPEFNVRASALTALCHVARNHSQLNLQTLRPKLAEVLARDPSLVGCVEDLQDDIEIFITRPKK
ncbi:hypothetical protein NA78x_005995 [Anatilimnocola sp. NA78]|uniref:hypothetical protein n=1 Tax=Anatilimnocola sp. NA78 TaxID=3415683 RepID=UPI003CE55A00